MLVLIIVGKELIIVANMDVYLELFIEDLQLC
jgi:hypothetical protein